MKSQPSLLKKSNVIRIVRMSTRINMGDKKYMIVCPFHLERTRSCEVNEKTMTFYCFSCGKKGDIGWKIRRQ